MSKQYYITSKDGKWSAWVGADDYYLWQDMSSVGTFYSDNFVLQFASNFIPGEQSLRKDWLDNHFKGTMEALRLKWAPKNSFIPLDPSYPPIQPIIPSGPLFPIKPAPPPLLPINPVNPKHPDNKPDKPVLPDLADGIYFYVGLAMIILLSLGLLLTGTWYFRR